MKIEKPLPEGDIAYVHVISPVIHDADYTVMQILYDAFPDERQALYESYRDAFAANLSLATGPVALCGAVCCCAPSRCSRAGARTACGAAAVVESGRCSARDLADVAPVPNLFAGLSSGKE